MGNAMKDLEARFMNKRHLFSAEEQDKMAQVITDYWLLQQDDVRMEREKEEQLKQLRNLYR
jgi:hypothetical protein